MIALTGIYPPIVTPFKDQEVSYSGLSQNIKKWNEHSLSGYVLLGSNGENVMLSESEALGVIDTAIKYIPEDKQIILGAGLESARLTVDFIRQARQIGGHAVLVVSPHYYKSQMTDASLNKYFQEEADGSELPVIIYNVPKFTGINISADLIAVLSEHPNIIGMKDSSGNLNYFQTLLSYHLPDFQLLTGSAGTLLSSLIMGAAGGILALANIAPRICLDIFESCRQGDLDRARELQLNVIRLNQLTTADYGIGGLKYALDQLGYNGGEPRSPLQLPDEAGQKLIWQELKKLSLI